MRKLNNNISKNTEIKFVGQPDLWIDFQEGVGRFIKIAAKVNDQN